MVARNAGSRTGGNQTADKNASAETNCETGDDSVPRGKPWKTALSGRSAFYSTRVHTDGNLPSPPSRCGKCLDAEDDARNGRLFSRDCPARRVVGVVNRLEKPAREFRPLRCRRRRCRMREQRTIQKWRNRGVTRTRNDDSSFHGGSGVNARRRGRNAAANKIIQFGTSVKSNIGGRKR